MQKQPLLEDIQLNAHIQAQSSRKDYTYIDYMELLKSKGLEINQKCFPSFFRLKNGLEYPGIATKEMIDSNQILVRIPKSLLLSSFDVIQRSELKQIFKQNFYHQRKTWQNRVLLTYLLYIYSIKQTDNVWYHMVNHFSKDIDVAATWSVEDLNKFKDQTLKSAAQNDRQIYEEQWLKFQQVKLKHQILQHQVFSKQNYFWILIHLDSRAFSHPLQFATFIPFFQFFNHHSVGGHFDIEKKNIDKKQQQSQSQQINEKQQTLSTSSEESPKSQTIIEADEYFYDQIQTSPLISELNEKQSLDSKQKQKINCLKHTILDEIQTSLNWDDFTIMFVPSVIQKCNLSERQYLEGKITPQKAFKDLKTTQQSVQIYRQYLIQAYKHWKGKNYKQMCMKDQIEQKQQQKTGKSEIKHTKITSTYFEFPTQQKKPCQNVILITGKHDKFLPNHQVYFNYSNHSNRKLLMWYGFAIQGNKYEYVHLSFDIVNSLMRFPATLEKLKPNMISRRRKFKIKMNEINMQLIMFFRLNSWSYIGKKSVESLFKIKTFKKQAAILNQIKGSLQFELSRFEGPYNLQDPKLSYHEYFIAVYHQQKQKILKRNIILFQSLIKFVNSLTKQTQISQAKQIFTTQQKFIFRHYLEMF